MASKRTNLTKELSKEQLDGFDFLRFTWTDMQGIARSKLVPKRNVPHMWKHGGLVYCGSPGFGPRAEAPEYREILEKNFGNINIFPDDSTLHVLPWAGGKGNRIAQVLCDAYWIETGEHHGADTRNIAKQMLDKLNSEFGLKCLMGWEHEFFLLDRKTKKPVFEGCDIYSTYLISHFEEFLCRIDKNLQSTGVDCMYFVPEYESGQLECPTVAEFGLKAVDHAFLLKEGVKEISYKEGYEAVFMTKPFADRSANGLHFNHSLWDNDGNNAFFDEKAPNKMSKQFMYWIGGIFKHFKALQAICCPTTNCYRRLYVPWAPVTENWGLDDRMASIRAKNYDKQNTYLENRLPSGSSNPYLVVAATLAAGMDGLRNKIEPPSPNDPEAPRCVGSLEEAMHHLEKDEVMKEALGEVLVRWWLHEKRTVEIAKVASQDREDEKLEAEKKLYYEFL